MLERTAASLESCSLQRFLSRHNRAPKRCRRLHTGFWQHGASAIELASLWPQPPKSIAAEPPSRPLQTGLVASVLLLDFLYPSGTRALLRRLAPMLSRSKDGRASAAATRKRCFTSSTVAEKSHTSPPPKNADAARTTSSQDSSALAKLLSQPDLGRSGRYLDVWDLYRRLDPSQQSSFRRDVAIYLAGSERDVEIERVSSLFRQIPVESRDDRTQAAAILTMMRAKEFETAVAWFDTGLSKLRLTGGLEYILAHFVAKQQWPELLSMWSRYGAVYSEPPPESRLLHLGRIPDLGKHCVSWERFVEQEGAGTVRAVNRRSSSRRILQTFRRTMAEASLKQVCGPRLAAVILAIWNDPKLYEQYLLDMLHNRARGLELRSSSSILSDIYRQYTTIPKVKPPLTLLHGMLRLYMPNNLAGMEKIYRDWHKAWGDLDQKAYESYLHFYAQAGDAASVRYLWSRYVSRFPEMLRTPGAFKSTMSVYAAAGNASRAEQELSNMMNKYGVMPDIDTWNNLLHCYTRAGDDDNALRCFAEIQRISSPNSTTYAHLMAMAAKRGDLRPVLDFFHQAQSRNVALSPAMCQALVSAYCRNDRLVAAEKLCKEVSARKIADTATWSQLLLVNGAKGRLDEVYESLQSMKAYGLDWDDRTYQAFLKAMVKVKKIRAAFHLLKSAHKDGLFNLGPEHVEIVLAGIASSDDPYMFPAMLSFMKDIKQQPTFDMHVSLLQIAAKKAPSAERTRAMGRELVQMLRDMMPPPDAHEHYGLDPGTPPPHVVGNRARLKAQTQSLGRAVVILVNLREYRCVEELVSTYAELFPEYKGGKFPTDVVAGLMMGCVRDNKISKTIAMWHQTFDDAVARCKYPDQGAIFPAHWYELCRPLSVLAKAYKSVDNGLALSKCVDRVVAADFKLTSTNWNQMVCYLADMGQWERAMHWCETMLMSGWRGWTPRPAKRRERHAMANNRLLIPSTHTVFVLQGEWLNLRKLAAWSGEVSQKLRLVEQEHPQLFNAFISNHFRYLPAAWVVRVSTSLNKAIFDMLRPLGYQELVAIRKALVYQLRILPTKRMIRSVMSPFHVATGVHQDVVLTKAFTYDELKLLEVELRNRMAAMGARDAGPTSAQGPAYGPGPGKPASST